MEAQGFVEIETPMLIASTPEGARDFVVPVAAAARAASTRCRRARSCSSSCAWSGGIDRYYQIARCLRDEDLRADRQFEFMQLDVEASFVGQDEVLAFVAEAVPAPARRPWPGQQVGDIPQMTWHEAMERYGSDKPDVRFGMELVELTEVFAATEFKAFAGQTRQGHPGAGRAPSMSPQAARRPDRPGQALGRQGPGVDAGARTTRLDSPVAKFLSEAELAGIRAALARRARRPAAARGRRAARSSATCSACCASSSAARRCTEGGLHFLWVVDFPLFEGLGDDGSPIPAHHPFTMPHPDDLDLLASDDPADLLRVRSQAYDLVLNGWELGSGSVRIHRSDVQQQIFGLLGIGDEEAQRTLRVPARRLPLRRAAARRLRLRHRPAGGAAGRRGEHPRGHRLPQDPVGRRPADPRPDPDRRQPPRRAGPAPPAAEGLRSELPRAPTRAGRRSGGEHLGLTSSRRWRQRPPATRRPAARHDRTCRHRGDDPARARPPAPRRCP